MDNSQRVSLSAEKRVIMVFVISALASIVIVGGGLRYVLQRTVLTQSRIYLESHADNMARQCENEIMEACKDLEFLSKTPAFQQLSYANLIDQSLNGIPENAETEKRQILKQLMNKTERFSVLYVLLPNADIYLLHPFQTQLILKKNNLSDRPYYQEAVRGRKTAISDGFVGADGILAVAILVPIIAESGEVVGYLGGAFHLSRLSQLVSMEKIKPFDVGFIVDRQEHLIAHTNADLLHGNLRENFRNHPLMQEFRSITGKSFEGGRDIAFLDDCVDSADEKHYLAAFVPLHSGWGLGMMRDRTSVIAGIHSVIWGITCFVSLLLAVISGMAVVFAQRIGRNWHDAERALYASEAALRESNEFLENLFNYANAPIIVWDQQFKITRFNHAFEKLTGKEAADVMGKSLEILFPPNRVDDSMELIRKTAAGDRLEAVDIPILYVDGTIRTVLWNSASIFESDQITPLVTIAQGQDITERKQAEIALQKSERRFRSLAVATSQIVWSTNGHGQVSGLLPSFQAYTGLSEEEIKGSGWISALHPDDVEQTIKVWASAVEGRTAYETEYRLRRIDGIYQYFAVRGAPVITDDDILIEWIGTCTDITERKRAEEALRDSEARYRALVENIPQKIFMKSRDFKWVSTNENFARGLGFRSEDVVGKSDWDLFPEELADKYHADDVRVMQTGQTEEFEERYVECGKETWVNTIKTPVRDENGVIVGVLGVFWDVTERKRTAENLQNALLDLKRSNQELEQFAYVASHDLQEPLRMVSSYTQLLGERYKGQLDEKAEQYIRYAVDGAARMQRLINDLLSFSRVATRGTTFNVVDSHAALGAALVNLQAAIEESGALVTNDELPEVRADASQLVLLFQNLIGNAIKFHGDKPPRVHVSAKTEGHVAEFWVQDNGIGIEPKYHDRVFVIFQRLHTREEYSGTGIGLAVCKRIVERHGGKIEFESEPGNGTTFHFTLPTSKKEIL